MEDTIKSVNTVATIIFKNGDTYNIPFKNDDYINTDLGTFATSCKLSEKLYETDDNSIIGKICGNTLSIEICSYDKLLVSSNKSSKYYGYMNKSAKIKLSVIGEDNVSTYMGTYYITSWENGSSNDDSENVSITACDLMTKIKNISLNKVRLKEHLTFSKYIISIINTLNTHLSDDKQIKYDTTELEKMNSIYSKNWQMWYNNIERTDIETIFNTIAKNTLCYIYIDRDNYLRVDCLLDDNKETPVCSLSGSTNLFSYNVDNNDIYNYDGVDVKYIKNVSYRDKLVLDIDGVSLSSGTNKITANLNSNKVSDVHTIEISADTGKAKCVSFYSFRDYIEMIIVSTADTKADINVFGKVIKESYDHKIVYNNSENKGTLLKVTNNIISGESNISKYANNFSNLISMENAIIKVEGYINPQVRLSDMADVTGKQLDISGSYKIVSLDFILGSDYSCTVGLIKTVDAVE